MKVKLVKIENYRSFGEENNVIELDSVTALVGKNESGKSNLIDCLGNLNLTYISDRGYFNNKNKNTDKNPIISIMLEPYEHETNHYGITGETNIVVSNVINMDLSGGLSEMINNNSDFQKEKDAVAAQFVNVGNNVFSNNTRQGFFNFVNNLINAENQTVNISTHRNNYIKQLRSNAKFPEFTDSLEACYNYLTEIRNLLPEFIVLENISLKSKYATQEIGDSATPNPMLEHLLNCMDLTLADIIKYWTLKEESDRENYKEDINKRLKRIVNKFNEFYKQETIELRMTFQTDSLNLIVRTTEKYIDYSERSNGLKWYFNMFIQLLSKTKDSNVRNYVILLDEPGVYLHVNAQQEILKLFDDFVSKGNQIIYTTQLPTMLYTDALYRTRLIIKDDNGNSNISNKFYSQPHRMGSKLETITPILQAIGTNLSATFSPLKSDDLNVVTEGISDYHYIKAFCLSSYQGTPNIIPSVGVQNIANICSILLGWGYRFKVVLDNDKEGKKAKTNLLEKLMICEDDVIYVNDSYADATIESLFSEKDAKNIGINNEDYKEQKAYYSLELLKKIENGEYMLDQETKANFNNLFSKINQ